MRRPGVTTFDVVLESHERVPVAREFPQSEKEGWIFARLLCDVSVFALRARINHDGVTSSFLLSHYGHRFAASCS
ncbi:hypothetical protein HEQ62_07420 [Haematospirillum jordaniae]|uniref:hypothetical protein n=1 Tax=Haematospirillum jordaniae TaxID=1549855 RepID=UPI001432E6DB|nr:hypothetical protein [Haematospirillum jordaniae]NKD45259.1 hypothetical protein [Haematospirillum jordaniae]NKD57251.1 hypothetical protein [Haematospirillum jordaniae]NKD59605.1 hypothetical protein [Haematospirillum jordaniae]NKD67177.1 hypothetical protein [Haematospirillum jordaniae]NKD79236.1 hypothetical protein [Haematospirillum jordaniae]